MDIKQEFDKYLVEWCKKNHKPIITSDDNTKKYWGKAMEAFMKDVLQPNYEDIKQEYLDMEYLKKGVQPKKQDKQTDWDKVNKILNENKK